MVKAKYTRPFATGLLAAAATIGPIIPPSIPFVIYGSLCNVSVGRMFLGGVIPGLLMGLSLMVIVYVMGKKYNFPREKRATKAELFSSLKDAALALLLPVFIVLGIITGATTPTEAAVVGVFYAAGLGAFVYREITFKNLRDLLVEVSIVSGAVMITISTAQLMSFLLAIENINQLTVTTLTAISSNPLVLLLIINIILLIMGCFLEPIPILLVMVPIFYPFIVKIGVDPIHFGVMITLNLMIGLLTPPVGMNLFIVSAIGNIPIMDVFKGQLPFMCVLILVLLIIMCYPPIVTWFPNLVMK
jgi:C4-dicarboxylate transporter, DctM subunit